MKNSFTILFFYLSSLLFYSCEQGPQALQKIISGDISTQVNPEGRAPLTALLSFATDKKVKVSIRVEGDIPVERTFSSFDRFHEIPVLGLYPGQENQVHLKVTTENNKIYEGDLSIMTEPLSDILPSIEVTKINRERMEPGFHLADMLIANNGKFLSHTIIFDDNGDIRWVMDMSETGQITYTSYRLQNGNWLYLNWIDLIEVDDLGRIVKKEQMWGNAGNHELIELPDGSLLMGGSKKDARVVHKGAVHLSRFDHVVQWDRKLNRAVREWDMRAVLDVDRIVYPPDFSPDYQADWFHVNAVARSTKDNSIIVSGRSQGVVKVNEDNQLNWILAPHLNWGKAGFNGQGLDTRDYLLTALDKSGEILPAKVQQGLAGTDDFEWSTGQHAVTVLENGNLLLFDNGLRRNFQAGPSYSRAVEYKIDEDNKTIQQIWSYGKERGQDMHSVITSDVDVLPQTGNRLIVAGNIRKKGESPHAKFIEISYPDNEVLFEAKVLFKDALGTKAQSWAQFDLVFRGERYPLIPADQ
ncbi:MAG: aryl-sulfate sulfotransferase [Saprospiraceae bacterium]